MGYSLDGLRTSFLVESNSKKLLTALPFRSKRQQREKKERSSPYPRLVSGSKGEECTTDGEQEARAVLEASCLFACERRTAEGAGRSAYPARKGGEESEQHSTQTDSTVLGYIA